MSKNDQPKADAKTQAAAADAPEADVAAQEAESNRLWKEMAAKHSDPHGSGATSEDQSDDATGLDDNDEAKSEPAEAGGEAKSDTAPSAKATETKDTTATETKTDAKPAKADASKDAPPANDGLWAKADKDPRTKALKEAYDAAPESARPAIEEAQRRLLEQGQEIHRHRSEKSATRKAAAPPAKKAEEEVPLYDPTTDEDLKKLKTDYPDVGEAVEKVIGRAVSSVAKRTDSKIAPIAETAKAHSEAFEEGELAKQNKMLHDRHPEYTKVVMSPGFREAFDNWVNTKSDRIRQIVEDNSEYVKDAAEVADVFELFQTQTKFGVKSAPAPADTKTEAKGEVKEPAKTVTDPAKTARRRQQLEGSTSVDNRGPGKAADADKNDEEYWRNYWLTKKAKDLSAEDRVH